MQRAHRSVEPVLKADSHATLTSLPWLRYYVDSEGIDLPVGFHSALYSSALALDRPLRQPAIQNLHFLHLTNDLDVDQSLKMICQRLWH